MVVKWKPHKGPQEKALRVKAFETLYGGARGGGKTDAGLVWMIKPVTFSRYRGLVIRKNSQDLRDWVDRARHMYSGLQAEVIGTPPEIRFPTGAKILTGHLKDDNAYEKYQGHEYQRMLLEELTQIPDEERYLKLIASCRSTVDGLDPRVLATTNPGGPGHGWVKKRFVSPASWGKKFFDKETRRSRIFIPAKVRDNPTLCKKDPGYLQFLDGLPTELRKAWRDGDWDVFVGMFFSEFERDVTVYNPANIQILESWPKFRSVDWGYSSPMAVYWHAVGPDRQIYTYREWYEKEVHDSEAARKVLELTADWEKIDYTVGDPQSFPVKVETWKFGKLVSQTRAQIWGEQGVPMIMGDSSRVLGWSRMREYLKVRNIGGTPTSWWHISNQCPNLLREISEAIYDDRNIEDISGDISDHALESCRLGLMSRPPLHQVFEETVRRETMFEAAYKEMLEKKSQGKFVKDL